MSKRISCNAEATARACFLCKQSWIGLDGREHRVGQDMSLVRDRAIERDGYKCVRCGGASMLEAHHKKHRGRGGGDSLANLETLCRSCHTLHHNRFPKWSRAVAEAR